MKNNTMKTTLHATEYATRFNITSMLALGGINCKNNGTNAHYEYSTTDDAVDVYFSKIEDRFTVNSVNDLIWDLSNK